MKAAGAVLVFLSFFSCGFIICSEKKKRRDSLTQLCFSLELMISELGTRACPLSELLSILSQRAGCYMVRFFDELITLLPNLGNIEFCMLWRRSAEKTLKHLSAEEKEEFIAVGAFLGRYELSDQLASVRSALCRFRAFRDAAREKCSQECRLSLGLSAVAGALLALVFI